MVHPLRNDAGEDLISTSDETKPVCVYQPSNPTKGDDD